MKINKIVIEDIAQYCIEKVFRINTNEPGFVHLDFGKDINSNQLRSIMVDLIVLMIANYDDNYDKYNCYHYYGFMVAMITMLI